MLSKGLEELLLEIYEKGSVSSDTQSIYSSLAFYFAIRDLKKLGLVEETKDFKGGEVKSWKLTKKGAEIAKRLKEVKVMLNE